MGENEGSAGEDLIADFLEEKGILFKRYPELPKLMDDNKSFRKPDFYLPEYGVYVEFLGQWNDLDHRQRYKQKMVVYYKNNIPCVYLWPDNLGTLDWVLRRRLREVFLKYNKKWTLFKYEWGYYGEKNGIGVIILAGLIYLIHNNYWRIIISLFLLYYLYDSINKQIKLLLKIKNSKRVSGSDYNRINQEKLKEK